MSARTIEHKMGAANLWSGTVPVGDVVLGNDMESFPEGAAGGLFDFANADPIQIAQIMIKFGTGTTSWSLLLVDVDAVETEVAAAANANPFFVNPHDGGVGGLIILQGQKLKLTSVGGPTTASRARISVSQHRD